ncbi:UDP-3-O-acyl-N-acetylglucosamine deacetylase [Pseudodesulfovibrio indicus]|uniref:UDP-3-O-acyl-N-acetylglucosamine deacetylase n=1 Tax=Pseudodesulfovibrio indicus TaxID=1716143 RepID=A0A126QNJ0_9BACT|nr:UDP-3-O-acyl-N-acetylglucosamine deacetylase [Pseudodesulfovibrio indicus]AMK11613.1 UDP-3-O-[3-hydroxymyristoyl] N-acetylglucosamine deacetylase [Pseudodesulfovibrio indicus]TDT90021.1 UDP-3-O-[3-hydroxymyristoyl] N-acetylglucosamine deacetylase [Pseudodesulfovibrio indicus]
MSQTTIHRSVRCTGIGLHSGRQVDMVLRPAAEDTGILFSLRNGSGSTFLTPAPSLVVETSLATVLGDGRETLATVEHLLAAINGMGIDNIHIEVSGKELPIMDGSAASFVYLLKQAGIRKLNKSRKVLAIKKAVEFEQDGKYIKATPYDGLRLDYTINFAHPLIGRQQMVLEITPENFAQHLAKARTFGFLKEVDYLHANGLALGGSLDNAVVLDEYNILNAEGLRFQDEFVRHKMLDFVGDMAIFGSRLQGHFEVFASGHALNNAFLRHLDENRDLYLEEKVGESAVVEESLGTERLRPVSAVA